MNIEALIQSKKSERVRKGLAVKITHQSGDIFNGYFKNSEKLDEVFCKATALIGVQDSSPWSNSTITKVEITQ